MSGKNAEKGRAFCRRNEGFSLLELLISFTVLSVLTGVLLQIFVTGRRIQMSTGEEEHLMDAAGQVMEEIKGFSLGNLRRELRELPEPEKTLKLTDSGVEYTCVLREDGALEIEGQYGEVLSENKRKICVSAIILPWVQNSGSTREKGIEKEKGNFENEHIHIGDIAADCNIVLMSDVLAEEKSQDEESEPEEEQERKYSLDIHVEERDILRVTVYLTENTDSDLSENQEEEDEAGEDIRRKVLSEERKRIIDENGELANRIYLFLSEENMPEQIFLSGNLKSSCQVYIIDGGKTMNPEDIFVNDVSALHYRGKDFLLYTNLDGDIPVASKPEESCLYQISVCAWIEDRGEGDEAGQRAELSSFKREDREAVVYE